MASMYLHLAYFFGPTVQANIALIEEAWEVDIREFNKEAGNAFFREIDF